MKIIDYHTHTNVSYCCDSAVTIKSHVDALEKDSHLGGVYITNHSFQIYFPNEVAWPMKYMDQPEIFDSYLEWGNKRLQRHLVEVESFRRKDIHTGIETEMMSDGRLTFDPAFFDKLEVVIGGVHWLPVSAKNNNNHKEIIDTWLRYVESILKKPIDILAHPFRWLSNQVGEIPKSLISGVVQMAQEAGVVLEINSHMIINSDRLMLEEIIRTNTPVVFATDTHRPDEVGNFSYHYSLLDELGLSLEELPFWVGRESQKIENRN